MCGLAMFAMDTRRASRSFIEIQSGRSLSQYLESVTRCRGPIRPIGPSPGGHPQVRLLGLLPQASGPLPVCLAWPRGAGSGRPAPHGAQGAAQALVAGVEGFGGVRGLKPVAQRAAGSLPATAPFGPRRGSPRQKLNFRNADSNPETCDGYHKLILALAAGATASQASPRTPWQLQKPARRRTNHYKTICYVSSMDRRGACPLPLAGLIRDRFRKN